MASATATQFRPASQIFLPSLVSAAPSKLVEPAQAQDDADAPVASTSSAVVPLPQFVPQQQLELNVAPPVPSPPPRKNSKTPPAKSGTPGTTPGADPTVCLGPPSCKLMKDFFSFADLDAPASQRKYICEWEGCGKAYTKPARLHEHYRSHTDEVSRFLKSRACGLQNCQSAFSNTGSLLLSSVLMSATFVSQATGEKPICRPICGRTSQNLNDLWSVPMRAALDASGPSSSSETMSLQCMTGLSNTRCAFRLIMTRSSESG